MDGPKKTTRLIFGEQFITRSLVEGNWIYTMRVDRGLPAGAELVGAELSEDPDSIYRKLVLVFESPWYQDEAEEFAVEVFCP